MSKQFDGRGFNNGGYDYLGRLGQSPFIREGHNRYSPPKPKVDRFRGSKEAAAKANAKPFEERRRVKRAAQLEAEGRTVRAAKLRAKAGRRAFVLSDQSKGVASASRRKVVRDYVKAGVQAVREKKQASKKLPAMQKPKSGPVVRKDA